MMDVSGWNRYRLTELFDMNNTKSIVQKNIIPDSGEIPYVTASEKNNGILTYISCPAEWIEPGNCIMIGGKTLSFSYQDKDFCSNDSHNIALYLKRDKEGGRTPVSVYLFMISALRASLASRYTWLDSISGKTIKEEYVYLPADRNGDPDWDYMESYMDRILNETDDMISLITGNT